MKRDVVVRWWPLVGLVGLVVLGLAVGKGTTPIDFWFTRTGWDNRDLGHLLVFTDGRVAFGLAAVAVAVALYARRWRLAAVVAAWPFLALFAARLCKRLFGRHKEGQLAYPSGHTTLTVVVLGLVVLVAGVAAWAVVAATVATVLGVLGQAFTYHYLTDAIGGVFLGTALVCLAAYAAGLDRCQPRCDLRHSDG